nr:MAG TPA: hypothetical protein [Caudoviricetes sp.]
MHLKCLIYRQLPSKLSHSTPSEPSIYTSTYKSTSSFFIIYNNAFFVFLQQKN